MSNSSPARRGLAATALLGFLWQRRQPVIASIRHEFANRYSGSLLGWVWVVLFPLLFLTIYAFVYAVVFRVRLPGGGIFDYVAYVFAGLVPYLAMMEAVNTAASSVRSQLTAIRSALMPIEIVPARVAGVAIVSMLVGMVLVVVLSAVTSRLSANIMFLPVIVVVHALFFLGLCSLLAVVGALVRDIAYLVNLFALMFLFLSPIAYTEEMLSPALWFLRDLNPVYYIVHAYRQAVFYSGPVDWVPLAIFVVMSLLMFAAGAAVLRRFKGVATENA